MDLRQLDPAIGRWVVQNPVTHHDYSPYNAFDNNPVYWSDPSGANSVRYNWGSGDYDVLDGDGKWVGSFDPSQFGDYQSNPEEFLQNFFSLEASPGDTGGGSDGGGGGDGNGGGNTKSVNKTGEKVLEAKTSVLGKPWATLEPREWVDQTTGLVYNVDANGKITRLRPLGGLGSLGYINGPSGVKLLVQFGKTENQVYHTFRHIEKMGLNKTVVQNAIMKHFQTVYKEIKEGQSLNKVITVQGQQIQYSAYRLSDGTINIGRIHGVK